MITIGGKKYLMPDELANKEGVSIQTIYKRIKDGQYKTRKLMDKTIIEI